jgi:hypothetical protein
MIGMYSSVVKLASADVRLNAESLGNRLGLRLSEYSPGYQWVDNRSKNVSACGSVPCSGSILLS